MPSVAPAATVRPKLLLIDAKWVPVPGNARLKYLADLRVDDVVAEHLREQPLEQFVDDYYCEECGRGFVSEQVLEPTCQRH